MQLYRGQIDLIAEFLSNMAVVWFAGAFINPANSTAITPFVGYGFISFILAVGLKGAR